MVQERVDRMDDSKELYYLIDYQKVKKTYTFKIIKKAEEEKVIKIKVDPKGETSCSCMDWKTRCKNNAIACKHIYYLLQTMLNYKLFDYYDNQIMELDVFTEQIKKRLRMNVDFNVKNVHKDVQCPICFIDFKENKNAKKCPDCNINVHEECMRVWLNHSENRNCVYCRSESWNLFF